MLILLYTTALGLALHTLSPLHTADTPSPGYEDEIERAHFEQRFLKESDRKFVASFMLRTSDVPLGPKLNTFSAEGVSNQDNPLIGMDIVKQGGDKGYWPLFGTTQSNLQVQKENTRWVYAYEGNMLNVKGEVSCAEDEVIIGIKYKSHTNVNAKDEDIQSLPDIQCAKLIIAQVDSYSFGSTHEVEKTDNGDSVTIRTTDTIKEVKQCMMKQKDTLLVAENSDRVLNTCASLKSRAGIQFGSSTSGEASDGGFVRSNGFEENGIAVGASGAQPPAFFVRHVAEIRRTRHRSLTRTAAGVFDFLVSSDWMQPGSIFKTLAATKMSKDFKNIFGSSSKLKSIDVAKLAKQGDQAASNSFESVWGETPPSPSEIEAKLGPNPWDSDKLIAASPEFLSGTLMSSDRLVVVTAIKLTGDSLTLSCREIQSCIHGACDSGYGCRCDPAYEGPNCSKRKDPCGSEPCGSMGTCKEDFSLSRGYKCVCRDNFTGDRCETSNDVCVVPDILPSGSNYTTFSQVDCGRGRCVAAPPTAPPVSTSSEAEGSAVETYASYTCECDSNWQREKPDVLTSKCSVEVSDCMGSWKNGACNSKCEQDQTFVISQPALGAGKTCEVADGTTRVSSCNWGACKSCMSKDCNGRGACQAESGVCKCSDGFSGDNCELEVSECSKTRCSSRGNCLLDGTCSCLNGWKNAGVDGTPLNGVYCSKDPCEGCPEGMCDSNTGVCACKVSPFGGCSQDANDCRGEWSTWGVCATDCLQRRYYTIMDPAFNGGAQCPAAPGAVETQPCNSGSCCKLDSKSCQNGGEFLKGSCSCLCPAGFKGEMCETRLNEGDKIVTREITVSKADMPGSVEVPEFKTSSDVSMSSEGKKGGVHPGIIAGAALLVLVGAYFMFFSGEEKKPEDPFASLEGMPGMEDVDFGALGLDDSQLTGLGPATN